MNTTRPIFVSFTRPLLRYVGLAFGVAFLNLITLGLYKPYGLTRVRKALYGHIYIGADALAYSGTAAALGKVTFYPSLALLFLMIIPGLLDFVLGDVSFLIGSTAFQLLLVVLAFHYLAFCQRRYELAHVNWRGLSFELTGSPWQALWARFGSQLAALFSLGLLAPWLRVQAAHRDYGALFYGSTPVTCTLTSRKLWMAYLPGWLASLAGLGATCLYVWNNGLMQAWLLYNGQPVDLSTAPPIDPSLFSGGAGDMGGSPDPEAMAQLSIYLNAVFLVFSAWPVWKVWRIFCLTPYELTYWRQLCASLAAGPLCPVFDGSLGGLFLLNAVSFAFNFTFANLTRPFTTYARVRYFCKNLLIRQNAA